MMWSRRSEAEIEEIQHSRARWYSRFNPIPAFGTALLAASVFLLYHVTGWRGKFVGDFGPKMSLSDALNRFPLELAATFVVAFVICIIGGRYLRRPSAVRTVICPRCRRTQTYFGADTCACGARFEPIEYWYWADDDVAAPNI